VFVFSLWFFSCRSLEGGFLAPSVSLGSVDIAGMSLEGVELLCKLNVENPNAVDIPPPRIGWEVFINGGPFLSGTVGDRGPVKARALTALDVPVSLGYGEIMNALKSFKGQDALYSITLEIRFLLPVLGELVWNFDYEGKIPLIRMIAFRDPSLRIENLDFNGADIVFSMDVENPNPFSLPFPAMDYIYAVRNSDVITGKAEFPGSLAPGRTAAEIRLRVEFSDLYRSVPALRTLGEAAGLFSLSSLVVLPGFAGEKLGLELAGGIPLLKAPVLSFRGISVKSIGLSKIDFEFGWDLENPNSFALELDNFEYSLLVNNNTWIQGKLPAKAGVAAGRKLSIPAAVSIDAPALVKDLTDIITRGMDVNYEAAGTVTYGFNMRSYSPSPLPFNLSGRTKLLR
jgi:LEA14-like dessication related protein